MNRDETRAALRLLHVVAMADGHVSSEEEAALRVACEAFGEEQGGGGKAKVDLKTEAARISSEGARVATFEAAVALATVDGRCSPEEHAVLEDLRGALRLDLPLPVISREDRWAERMREPRRAMRSAEVDFLHAVAAKREGMTVEEYRSLLDELHRVQSEALRGELDPALEGRASYVPER